MPVIQFPGYTKDPFGGPAGGTQQAFAAMLSSYMKTQEELKKREQEKLLAELLAGGGRPQQLPGMEDPAGPVMNPPTPAGGYPVEGPQDYKSRAQALMSNPALDMRQKIQGMGLLAAQKELEPVAAKTKYVTINWWDKDGKAGKPYVVPEDSANQLYERLDAMGATWEAAPKESADPELVKYQKIAASLPDGPQKRQIEAYIAKMIRVPPSEGGGDPRDKGDVKIGDTTFTQADLRAHHTKMYGLVDESKIMELELNPSFAPQAAKLRARNAEAPAFDEAVSQWRRQGFVPGINSPITSTPEKISKEAAAAPVDDEAAKLERMTPSAGGTPPPPPPAKVKDPERFKQLLSTPEGQALRQAGWPGDRPPTAAEIAKAKAALQSKQVRK